MALPPIWPPIFLSAFAHELPRPQHLLICTDTTLQAIPHILVGNLLVRFFAHRALFA